MLTFIQLLAVELKAIFTDRSILLTMFGGIIMYSIIYPLPYSTQVARDLPIAVIDHDKSSLSRELTRMVDATPDAAIVQQLNSRTAAEALVKQDVIKGFIEIPEHFRRDILQQKPVTVAVASNATYFMVYSTIASAVVNSTSTLAAKVKISRLAVKTNSMDSAVEQWQPAKHHLQPVFNDTNGYLDYVVPAVFVLILQQTLLISCGLLSGRQNELGTEPHQYQSEHYWLINPAWRILLARGLIFISLYLMFSLYYFGFSFDYYGITRLASALDLILLLFPFLCATVGFGLMLGQLFKHPELATQIILFSSMPMLFASGFIWPVSEIPSWIVFISEFIPSTPAIKGFLQLNQMGACFDIIASYQQQLLWQALGYSILAIAFLTIRQSNWAKRSSSA